MPRLDAKSLKSIIAADNETTKVDFKRTINIGLRQGQAELIKDVLAIANCEDGTDEPGYLIIGASGGNAFDINNLGLDDATLQQIVNSRVHPPVRFEYYHVVLESGAKVGVFEVPVSHNKPHCVKTNFTENAEVLLHEGFCPVRQGTSTKIAMKEDYDAMYKRVIEKERRLFTHEAINYYEEKKSAGETVESDPMIIDENDLAKTATALVEQKDYGSLTTMIRKLRTVVIEKWKDSRGKPEDEVKVAKHTFVKPCVLKLAIIGSILVTYGSTEPFQEVLKALISIYGMANDTNLGIASTQELLLSNVPSKEVAKAVYAIGAVAISNERYDFCKLIFDCNLEVTVHFRSVEPLVLNPLRGSQEGNLFKEAQDDISSTRVLFEMFDLDEERVISEICKFDLLTAVAFYSESNPLPTLTFAYYGQSKVRDVIEEIEANPQKYVPLLGEDGKLKLESYLKKLGEHIGQHPVSFLYWRM